MQEQAFDLRHLGLGSLPSFREGAFQRELTGVGSVLQSEPSGYNASDPGSSSYDLKIISVGPPVKPPPGATWTVQGTWVKVYPNDPTGQFGIAGRLQSDIQTALASPKIAGKVPPTGHSLYFALSDPHSGAAQTPGEPAGVVLLRANLQSDGSVGVSMCTSPATLVVNVPPPPLPVAPPAAVAPASTNTIWWVVLGLAVVGVGGYVLLD